LSAVCIRCAAVSFTTTGSEITATDDDDGVSDRRGGIPRELLLMLLAVEALAIVAVTAAPLAPATRSALSVDTSALSSAIAWTVAYSEIAEQKLIYLSILCHIMVPQKNAKPVLRWSM
jgi:hypothetical protein